MDLEENILDFFTIEMLWVTIQKQQGLGKIDKTALEGCPGPLSICPVAKIFAQQVFAPFLRQPMWMPQSTRLLKDVGLNMNHYTTPSPTISCRQTRKEKTRV